MLKDYAQLFAGEPEEEAAIRLAGRVKHISEVVAEAPLFSSSASASASSQIPRAGGRKVTYHSSCHLRAAGVTKQPRQVLTKLPGIEYVEMVDADRCAGGAGTYLVKDYETSQRIVERKRRAVEQSGAEVVATSCPACMIQLRTGLKGRADVQHVAQVVADALGEGPRPHGDGGEGAA
jgi:Fe-S oxidoreductase